MQFTFIGDGDNDPESITLFGYTFPLGVAVEVDDERAIAKLKGNRNFAEGEAAPQQPVRRKPGRPSKSASLPPKVEQVDPDDFA